MKKSYEKPVIEAVIFLTEQVMNTPSVAFWGYYDDVDGRLDRIED